MSKGVELTRIRSVWLPSHGNGTQAGTGRL